MYSFSVTTAVCGFHVYKDVWEPTIGEVLSCERILHGCCDTHLSSLLVNFISLCWS